MTDQQHTPWPDHLQQLSRAYLRAEDDYLDHTGTREARDRALTRFRTARNQWENQETSNDQ